MMSPLWSGIAGNEAQGNQNSTTWILTPPTPKQQVARAPAGFYLCVCVPQLSSAPGRLHVPSILISLNFKLPLFFFYFQEKKDNNKRKMPYSKPKQSESGFGLMARVMPGFVDVPPKAAHDKLLPVIFTLAPGALSLCGF